MSSRTLGENLHTSARTIGLKPILKLLQNLQKQNPDVDDSALIHWLMYSPLTDLHNTEIIFEPESRTSRITNVHRTDRGYYNSIHRKVYPHPHTYSESNIGSMTAVIPAERKYGAGITFGGDGYLSINDNDHLKISPPISIVFWIKISEDDNTQVGDIIVWMYDPIPIQIRTISTNKIRALVRHPTAFSGTRHSTITLPNDHAWHHVVCTIGTTYIRLYLDGVLANHVGTHSASTFSYSHPLSGSDGVRIGQGTGSGNNVPDTVSIAHLGIYSTDISTISGWIADDMDGFRRLADVGNDGRSEIVSLPFNAGSLKSEPMALPGFCYPSE